MALQTGIRLLVQPRLRVPDCLGREGRTARPSRDLHVRRRRVHVQRISTFDRCQIRDQCDDSRLQNDSHGNVARDLNDLFEGAYGTDLHNPDFVKFAESFGAVGMRADDPTDLEKLIPLALERQAPVVIDVPFAEMPIPRAPQIAFVYNLPWTQPQEGLISS